MNYRLSLLLMTMTLHISTLHAENLVQDEAPAIDFLEFLGEWETSEGEWLDPNEFEDEAYAGLFEVNIKGQNNE